MLPYLLVIVIALIYYFTLPFQKRSSSLYLAIFFLYLSLFVGLGDMIGGYDRYIYGSSFDYIADQVAADSDYKSMLFLINGSEYGYFVWEFLLAHITANRYIFILITTLTIYILFFFSFKSYIKDYPLVSILFLGLFYYFTMTYLRQVLAVGIAWQGVRYVWQRKPFHFFAIMAVAYSFHNSVLIFAPFYFVPIKKYSKNSIILFLFFSLILGMSPLPSLLISSSGNATGMVVRTAAYEEQVQGFRIEYIFEVVLFIWLIFKNYTKIEIRPQQLVFLNMSIIFCGLLMLFMRFGQGGRFGWYYLFGLFYTFTTLCNRRDSFTWMRPLVISVSIILFLRVTFAWSSLNAPYKTFLTNGEPCGDGTVYKGYEYDLTYTQNKLYR